MAIRDETRMLLESMTRLFEDKSTKTVIDRAEIGTFADDLWRAVAETGVPLAALPESPGVPTPNGPTFMRYCGWPAAIPRRSRLRKQCWPAGSPRVQDLILQTDQ